MIFSATQQLVGADLRSFPLADRRHVGRLQQVGNRHFEKACLVIMDAQQCEDAFEEDLIVSADLLEISRASLDRFNLRGDFEDRLFVKLAAFHITHSGRVAMAFTQQCENAAAIARQKPGVFLDYRFLPPPDISTRSQHRA